MKTADAEPGTVPLKASTRWPKPWSEPELLRLLASGGLQVPPATISLVDSGAVYNSAGLTGLMQAAWGDKQTLYAFLYLAQSATSAVRFAIDAIRRAGEASRARPLVIVPYLSESSLDTLTRDQISGVDLCGNAILLGADFHIYRTGAPNRFPPPRPAYNVYAGRSSIITRCFLLKPDYPTLSELFQFAATRMDLFADAFGGKPPVSLGMASKVCHTLVEDLLIDKNRTTYRLIDRLRLMEELARAYRRPREQAVAGTVPLSPEEMWARLRTDPSIGCVATGLSSARHYGVLADTGPQSFYVTDLSRAAALLDLRPTRAFPNIRLIEETHPLCYWDARTASNGAWSSPIQTWLELSNAGPREKAAATSMGNLIRLDEGEPENG